MPVSLASGAKHPVSFFARTRATKQKKLPELLDPGVASSPLQRMRLLIRSVGRLFPLEDSVRRYCEHLRRQPGASR